MRLEQQFRDTGRRRDADAARVRAVAVARFRRFPRLYHYTLPLHLPGGVSLYSREAARASGVMVGSVFGAAPARWKRERGWGGALHLHVVSPLPPLAVHEALDARPVYALRPLLAYLSKPGDAPLCRPGRLTPWTPDSATRAREYRAALLNQARAREARRAEGGSRLPPLSGWTGCRPVESAPPLHVARCALALLLLTCAHLLALYGPATACPALTPAPRRAGPFTACTAPRRPYRPPPRGPERTRQGLAR